MLEYLETEISRISGVDLFEEMANMMAIRQNYAAAVKCVKATNDLFDMLTSI